MALWHNWQRNVTVKSWRYRRLVWRVLVHAASLGLQDNWTSHLGPIFAYQSHQRNGPPFPVNVYHRIPHAEPVDLENKCVLNFPTTIIRITLPMIDIIWFWFVCKFESWPLIDLIFILSHLWIILCGIFWSHKIISDRDNIQNYFTWIII